MEETQLPELLPMAVRILQFLASTHLQAFRAHFTDLVDLLVGWCLDPGLPIAVTTNVGHCFQTFHELWLENLVFARDLLEKFVADMDSLSVRITNGMLSSLILLIDI